MSYKRQEENNNLDQLLFSRGEDSHNLSSEHSYNEIEECEANFIEKMNSDEQWGSNDNYENQFMRINGPSVEFSQNFSQNSVNLSGRHSDDSRDYKNGKYLKILEEKKREEVEFNRALDQELTATQQELERKSLEISKLENQNRAFEIKFKRQDGEIERNEIEIEELKEEINQLQGEKVGLLKKIEYKDQIFESHRHESGKILHQLSQKVDQNGVLKQEINSLHIEMGQLSENLAVFQEPDRNLLNFRGKYTHANNESPINSNNNDKELIDKLRMEKSNLDIELSSIRDKLEDRESRFRKIEEEHKKKVTLKEKKCKEVELRLAELKDEQIKIKTQNEIHLERLNNSLAAKNKELNAVSERLQDSDRRIKALLEDGKRKDERNKETTLELIEKGKLLHESQKMNEETKIQLEFDHQMIENKDEEIERLYEEKKSLRVQIDSVERVDRDEKVEKSERDTKTKKQSEKHKKEMTLLRKESENLKKERDSLGREKEDLAGATKDSKRKFEEVSKKMVQLRSMNSQLEEEMKNREEESELQRQALDKAMKELTDIKKKNETVPQLRNKIILLQSRLKNEHQYRSGSQSMESEMMQDRIDALEHRLDERNKENHSLKSQLKTGQCSDEEMQDLQFEIADRDQMIENLEEELQKRSSEIMKLHEELTFKDNTLDFTHTVLVKSEKAKIELEQEKKMLEEMINNQEEGGPISNNEEDLSEFYEHQIGELERKLGAMQKHYKEKDEEHRFELKQQKERIRELNDMLLSKERRITPETMSQEETVAFLTKTLRRVIRSSDMLRILERHHDFRENLTRMERQFRR